MSAVDVSGVMRTKRDDIALPSVLDRVSIVGLRARIERALDGESIALDGSRIERVETLGVQLLCALVLAAEGRGVAVVWLEVPLTLISYVNLLGIGDVMRLEGMREKGRVVRMTRPLPP